MEFIIMHKAWHVLLLWSYLILDYVMRDLCTHKVLSVHRRATIAVIIKLANDCSIHPILIADEKQSQSEMSQKHK